MPTIKVDCTKVPKTGAFRYLGSTLQADGQMKKEVETRVAAMWAKWRMATGVLCDKQVSDDRKGYLYKAAIRPVALYGCETWPTSVVTEQHPAAAGTKMLRWSLGHTRHDKIRNDVVRKRTGVATITKKMRERRMRRFDHI